MFFYDEVTVNTFYSFYASFILYVLYIMKRINDLILSIEDGEMGKC